MVPDTFAVVFAVSEEDSTIEVKDSEGEVVGATAQEEYELVNGSYSYTVNKEFYTEVVGNFTVMDDDLLIEVELELE